MKRYYITDRRHAGGVEALLHCVRRAAGAGVEMIQVREKDLAARELAALVRRILGRAGSSRVLVNTRLDVALACGAHGVHLPAEAPSPADLRPLAAPDFLIGVSCHTVGELRRAEREGADFAVYGPVFRPLSKEDARATLGLAGLREGCRAVAFPVYALGGITWANADACLAAGAAGVAGITLFQAAETVAPDSH